MKRGISALEALIALAIAGAALAPLIVLQADTTRAISAAREDAARASATRNMLAMLDTINPMDAADGRIAMGAGETLAWRTERITPITRALAYGGVETNFDVALYRIDAVLQRQGDAPIALSVERVGWRSVAPDDDAR